MAEVDGRFVLVPINPARVQGLHGDNRYFTDKFRQMRSDGYTAMLDRMLDLSERRTARWQPVIRTYADRSALPGWFGPARSMRCSTTATASCPIAAFA